MQLYRCSFSVQPERGVVGLQQKIGSRLEGGLSWKNFSFTKQAALAVFGGNQWFAGKRPIYAQIRIVPENTAFVLRRPEIGGQIEELGML